MVVLLIVAVALKIHQLAEHIARAHMVTVDQCIAVGKVRSVAIVHENAAVGVYGAVDLMVQIINIVIVLKHRIVDGGALEIEPGHSIGILLAELVEIYLEILLFLLSLAGFANGILPGHGIIELGARIFFRVIAVYLIGREAENGHQHGQHNIIKYIFHCFLLHGAASFPALVIHSINDFRRFGKRRFFSQGNWIFGKLKFPIYSACFLR